MFSPSYYPGLSSPLIKFRKHLPFIETIEKSRDGSVHEIEKSHIFPIKAPLGIYGVPLFQLVGANLGNLSWVVKIELYVARFLMGNTHAIRMIKIQVTICIHNKKKKKHSYIVINISIQMYYGITINPYHI